jgi:signal transduction histidine kinase
MSQQSDDDLTKQELRLKMATEMAHEFRTPLGGIIGINELLLTSQLDSEQMQFAETINDSAKIMLQLLTDLVELARLDANKITLKSALFNPQSILDECAFALRKFLRLHNIELTISVAADLPDLIPGDAACLQQALTSIIVGSSKFIESGVISLDATPGAASDDQKAICFTIILPPNTVNRNHEPIFTQLAKPEAPVQRFDSTWMRLSIAQKLLMIMNALVEVSGNTLQFTILYS